MTQSTNGYQKGDSFNLVTPPPTYEGELAPGEQANAEFVDQLEGEELLDELQDGGYVIYFRHAQTERDFADQVSADVNDYSTQRVLSEFGVQQSLAIAEGFEISDIPIGSVTTSEYGRAVTTAAIAFGEYQKDSALNFLPFEDYTDEQVEQMKENVTPFLTAVPEAGTNNIIVGHDDLFEAGSGIYPDPQGIAYLLKPDGSGDFEIIANLLPEEWVQLSGDTEIGEGTSVDNNDTGSIPNQGGEGWSPGDSFNLVTPPPTYEGELAPGEQANAEFVDQLEGEELLDELQDGGYVIYFRHAQTERDFADQVSADVNDYSTQRVLSEFGVQQSLAIAEGFEISDIPIGSVTTSEYGRAVTTAAIAFGEYQKDSALNFLPFEDYTDEQVEQMKGNVTPFLTAIPEAGTNNIIVGHDDLFEAGTGIYPDPQGIAYILEPDGNGGFEIVANLLPEEWVQLSGGDTSDTSFSPVFGSIDGETIEVDGGNQLVFAGDSNDLIDASISSGGGNRIYAGSGDDTVILGSSDRIIGGAGDDKFFITSSGDNTITGGVGADQFWIATAEIPEAANTITDFTSGEDVLGIAGLGIGFEDLSITQQDDNTLIAANGSDLAILQGVDSLMADNFAFV